MSERVKGVVVIGAGVVGLTTAIRIQEHGGYHVTIVAETVPGDTKSIRYTSPWAGAHHVSAAFGDLKLKQLDKETFDIMWEMSKAGSETEGLFLRVHQTDYYEVQPSQDVPFEWMPNFQLLRTDLIEGTVLAASFATITIDTPVYLPYLLARFLAKGGSVIRSSLQHISQVLEGALTASKPDALVVCAGIGARFLGGVEDKDVHPIRGQTVLIRAPWVKFGRTLNGKGEVTYIIPRRSGDVILGGTRDVDDWYPKPRPETKIEILKRSIALAPELAPPGIKNPTYEDLIPLVIEDGCGLRPGRKGGIRLERETVSGIPVIHNYGHGGYGYQSSWGSAFVALKLLDGAW
ncbi:D-amino-acid oxidase [Thelephora terrestris]|uniref:D-amino-acid oxidase n=1 Tax=Thelephora terrestris TaxID=56493 RepID=A0A9P6HJ48_9AGAM|nr:D-amino-acid oxidase [Thelephora terrestris]